MDDSKEKDKSGCGCGSNVVAKRVIGNNLSHDHQKELINRIQKTAKNRKNTVYKTKAPLFI